MTIKNANTIDVPHTINPSTKLAELQILKPEETRMIRPVDVAALNLQTDHDDVATYINELMQVERPEDNEETFWFSTPEKPVNKREHSPKQKRILKKLRKLSKSEKLDPTENKKHQKSRNKFLSMFKWTDSLFTGKDRENLEATIVDFNDIFVGIDLISA